MAKVTLGGRTYEVEVRGETVVVDGREIPVAVREDEGALIVKAGGVLYRIELPPEEERTSGMEVRVDYRPYTVQWEGSSAPGVAPATRKPTAGGAASSTKAGRAAPSGAITAQIAGRIVRVNVKPGDAVKAGDVLLILEAMKMENEIKAAKDGTVKEVLVTEGARVSEGEALVVLE